MKENEMLCLYCKLLWIKALCFLNSECNFSIQIIVQHLQGQVKELKGTKDALAVSKIREETLQNQVVTQLFNFHYSFNWILNFLSIFPVMCM